MPKYSPLINTVVSVRLPEIEAESQEEAAKKALAGFTGAFFDGIKPRPGDGFIHLQWAEENDSVLIDEVGDEEFDKSCWYKLDEDGVLWKGIL